MPKTYYLSDSILNYLSKNGNFTQPESLYVALFTAMPGAGGGEQKYLVVICKTTCGF